MSVDRSIINTCSLYEYLGEPAGPDLGKAVYASAKSFGVPVSSQPVENKNFSGYVLVYPRPFLEAYFKDNLSSYRYQSPVTPTLYQNDDDDLPF
jgi:hypothetical protein